MSRTNFRLSSRAAPAFSFALVAGLLVFVHLKVDRPMLLLERFLPGWGWIEIAVLASSAAWLTLEPFDGGSVQSACKQRGATVPDEKCPVCPY